MFGTFKPGMSIIRRSAVIRHLLCWESWLTVCTKPRLLCQMLIRKHRESTVSNIWLVFVYLLLFQLRRSDNTFSDAFTDGYFWSCAWVITFSFCIIATFSHSTCLLLGFLCVWLCYLSLIASYPGYLNLIICWIILPLSRRNTHFRPWCGWFQCEHHSARPCSS